MEEGEAGRRPWRDTNGPRVAADVERVGAEVVDAAYTVHSALGPGLLESVYEACLAHELRKRGLGVATQVHMPLMYDGERFDEAFRLDMLVDDRVIVEVKATEAVTAVHKAQLRTYLRLAGLELGYVINFSVTTIRDGIRRVIIKPLGEAP